MLYYGEIIEYCETVNSPQKAKRVYKELLYLRLRERIPELKDLYPKYISFIENKNTFHYRIFLRVLEISFSMFMNEKGNRIIRNNRLNSYNRFKGVVQFWHNNNFVVDMYNSLLIEDNRVVNQFGSIKL
jgi:hypothetical protein